MWRMYANERGCQLSGSVRCGQIMQTRRVLPDPLLGTLFARLALHDNPNWFMNIHRVEYLEGPALVTAVVRDVRIGAAGREQSPWLAAQRTQPARHTDIR